jgi:hypothetical protein
MPAAQATTARSDTSNFPADCTYNSTTLSLTCTARPADQQWQLTGRCEWPPTFRYGTVVTGDGTSTVYCVPGVPLIGASFNVVS